MKELHLTTNQKNQMIDITEKIQQYVREEKIIDGYLIVYIPHTTAAVTINEGADPSVQQDIMDTLEKLVPENPAYHHPEGNSDAHIKASLLGSSVTVLISKGSIVIGTWQHIFFYEADGPRHRTVYLYINKDR